ncbi:MFS transporter [Castellaniella sp. FW104-16D08]|uniref:MFS transporter n=1 Tax=unclassified Castellaniella TaxID=2617606 RepID=UPI0033151C3E
MSSSLQPSPVNTASSAITLTATVTIQSLVAMSLLTLPAIAPAIAAVLDVPTAYVGVYVALAYMGAMAASLLSGSATRRYGAIRASQAGLILCALGLLLSTLASVPLMALGAILIGLGYGPITPASSHLLARTTPPDRMSFVFSIKQTGVPLGGVLAGLIVPGLAQWLGWQAAFGVVAAANAACALAVQPLRKSLDADQNPKQKLSAGQGLAGPLRLVFSQRSLAVLAGVSFLFSITQLSLTSYMVTFLHHDLAMDLVAAGVILAVSQAAGVGGRLLWGYVSDHYLGPVSTLAGLAALVALCALATPFLHLLDTRWVLILVLCLFGGSAIGWNGIYLAEVARQAPDGMASMATGGTLAMTFLGVVVGPPIFGWIASLSGSYGFAYATLMVPAGVCLVLLWRYRGDFKPGSA